MAEFWYCLRLIVWACVLLLSLEGVSRAIHWNARPMIPYVLDDMGLPRMAPDLDISVGLPGHDRFKIVTDSLGARVAGPDSVRSNRDGGILVAGDSQALGWGMNFGDTLASILAKKLIRDADRATTMAAAGTDPESLLGWAADYRSRHPERQRLLIVMTNLGNDLDEMFFSRGVIELPVAQRLKEWLSVHSFLFLDLALTRNAFVGEEWGVPPGTNPVLFALDTRERQILVSSVASAIESLAHALPPADETVVVIVPNDYQVNLKEFDKYKAAYREQTAVFDEWHAHAGEASRRLSGIADDLAETLRAKGFKVVDTTEKLKSRDATQLFDRHSHHLTALGHQIVANAVSNAVSVK